MTEQERRLARLALALVEGGASWEQAQQLTRNETVLKAIEAGQEPAIIAAALLRNEALPPKTDEPTVFDQIRTEAKAKAEATKPTSMGAIEERLGMSRSW